MRSFKSLLIVLMLMVGTTMFAQDKALFAAYDVIITPTSDALAAYQFEFTFDKKLVSVVGIEGGEKAPFPADKPPYYDPTALTKGRLIVAAFTTSPTAELPTGKCRVATLHLQVKGSDEPKLQTKLKLAANAEGKRIQATIELKRREKK